MKNTQIIIAVSKDVIFKPYFVNLLVNELRSKNIEIKGIIEVANKTKKNYPTTWSLISYLQMGLLFFIKKSISVFPIPMKFKYKSTVKLVSKFYGIPYFYSYDLNLILQNLKLKNNDIFISFQHQIIKKPENLNFSLINCHPGDLKLYRGIKPIFWAMLDKNKNFKISVHFIDKGIDTGEIIKEKKVKLKKQLGDNYFNAYKYAPRIITEAVLYIQSDKNPKSKNKLKRYIDGIYRKHPTKKEIKYFYQKNNMTKFSLRSFFQLIKTF